MHPRVVRSSASPTRPGNIRAFENDQMYPRDTCASGTSRKPAAVALYSWYLRAGSKSAQFAFWLRRNNAPPGSDITQNVALVTAAYRGVFTGEVKGSFKGRLSATLLPKKG